MRLEANERRRPCDDAARCDNVHKKRDNPTCSSLRIHFLLSSFLLCRNKGAQQANPWAAIRHFIMIDADVDMPPKRCHVAQCAKIFGRRREPARHHQSSIALVTFFISTWIPLLKFCGSRAFLLLQGHCIHTVVFTLVASTNQPR